MKIHESNSQCNDLVWWHEKYGFRRELNKVAAFHSTVPARHVVNIARSLVDALQSKAPMENVELTVAYPSRGALVFWGSPDEVATYIAVVKARLLSAPPMSEKTGVQRALVVLKTLDNFVRNPHNAQAINVRGIQFPSRFATLDELERFVENVMMYRIDTVTKKINTTIRMRRGWKDEYLQKAYDLMTIENVMKG